MAEVNNPFASAFKKAKVDNPLAEAIRKSEEEKAALREAFPELNEQFDAFEAAVDEAAIKYSNKLEEKELYAKLNEALNGRLEGEVPLSDEYWNVRNEVQEKLAKMKG